MLIFDQLKKDEPRLRALATIILTGLFLLSGGLWWVQVVSSRDYQANLETQSFRTVRIPAVRGQILDHNGNVLAENRPTYNITLYLEDLRKNFDREYVQEVAAAKADLNKQMEERQKALHRSLTKAEKKQFTLSGAQKNAIRQRARCEVASNVVQQISQHIQVPLPFDPEKFERHYETRLALPYPVLNNVDATNIARFEETAANLPGVDLEVQSTRVYPHQTTAAHLLGRLQRDDSSEEGEESFFSYRLPDFRGLVGIEAGYDRTLRGMAGAKSVMVDNLGYNRTENIWTPATPGSNVVLTIDLRVQQAAERALQNVFGPATKGAAVVMDVRSGDILAMASSPTLNPNAFIQGISQEEMQRINELYAEKNRATQERYMPGSIFKIMVGLAGLEAGWDPQKIVHVQPNPRDSAHGYILVGNHPIRDTAVPGDYDFDKALEHSCNAYFITCGLWTGMERIVRLSQHCHFGERIGLPTHQETAGTFPSLRRIKSGWTEGNTANCSIGADPIWVTPLQVAVMTAAVANGGTVLWPRLVERIEPPDMAFGASPIVFPPGLVRDQLGVSAQSMRILHDAMLKDTEDPGGTGRHACVPGIRICGKTGTAQVQDENNRKIGQTTWFASFAPYDPPAPATEKPRYAVVIMVENGASGGDSCAPAAKPIYQALLEREKLPAGASVVKVN